MNAPEKITSAEPINAAHEVLMKAADAMCTQQIASEIHGRPRPTKPQMKAVDKWLKELHACGMLTSQPGRGGAALYSLITPVCNLVQTEGKSQTAAFAERILTPEAEAEREDFEAKYGMLGNCSCHIFPPCGSCTHPGNPRNQEEDETAWMAAGDSEGGEADAPAWATDPALQYLAPEDYEMPPADPKLLAMANRALHDQAQEFRGQLSSIAATVAEYLPDPSNISTARAVEILDMLADAQSKCIRMLELDAKGAHGVADSLQRQINKLRTRAAEQAAQHKSDIANLRTAHNHALNEADRLRAELAAERQAREALQEQAAGPASIAGYIIRAAKRKPRTIMKADAAKSAALGAIRAGAQRADVFALVRVGTARRGAEWGDA